jgi:ribose 5-phosphate isomerase B
MKIAIGADHAGFALKEQLRASLEARGHTVTDFGTFNDASTDYPDYAAKVCSAITSGAAERGVLVCYTGIGMSMSANKRRGIRAALACNADAVSLTRRHNNANVLALGAKYTTIEQAEPLVDIFLTTAFEGGRHQRRIDKIESLAGGEKE